MAELSAQELPEIKARHFPTPSGIACDECGHLWPCEVFRLLARIEELEKGLRVVLAGHLLTVQSGRRACCVCSPQDGRWPCVTVLEARAALEGKA